MFYKKIAVLAIILLSWVTNPSLAKIVDVTKTSILVEDTNANDPIKLKQALAQILVKNTGESLESILQNPVFLQTNVQSGIKRSYFERIETQYLAENSPYHYWYHIVVQESFIKRIIDQAGFSLLPINRNEIMLWMVKEFDAVAEDQTKENTNEILSQSLSYVGDDDLLKYWMDHWAQAIGLDIVFPQLDELDKIQVKPESIKSLSYQASDQTKNRYDVHNTLLIYVKKTEELKIRSGYVSNGDEIIINHYQDPLNDAGSLLYAVMADVANNYFQKIRIDSSDLLQHSVRVVINSIENYNSLMQVQDYLSNLSVIDSYEIVTALNGQLVLNVNLLIKNPALLEIINRDKILAYQQDSPINKLIFDVINL